MNGRRKSLGFGQGALLGAASLAVLLGGVPTEGPTRRLEQFEIAYDPGQTFENPYDPEQVELLARFTTPDGTVETVDGFWYQGFSRRLVEGKELLEARRADVEGPVHAAPGRHVRVPPRAPRSRGRHGDPAPSRRSADLRRPGLRSEGVPEGQRGGSSVPRVRRRDAVPRRRSGSRSGSRCSTGRTSTARPAPARTPAGPATPTTRRTAGPPPTSPTSSRTPPRARPSRRRSGT